MFKEKERVFMFNTNCHELSINYSLITVSIMNKKVYQEPTTKVVGIKAARIICTSVKNVSSGNVNIDYGGGGDGEARSRGIWDRWE